MSGNSLNVSNSGQKQQQLASQASRSSGYLADNSSSSIECEKGSGQQMSGSLSATSSYRKVLSSELEDSDEQSSGFSPEEEGGRLITYINGGGPRYRFMHPNNAPLDNIFRKYTNDQGTRFELINFFYKGHLLKNTDTLLKIRFRSGDDIRAVDLTSGSSDGSSAY